MRKIAYAPSVNDYNFALKDMCQTEWYKENIAVQNYVKNRWINIKEVWKCKNIKQSYGELH